MNDMEVNDLAEAVTSVDKFNVGFQPELLDANAKRTALELYCKLEKLAAYGKAMLASALDDPAEVARMSGSSVGKAKAAVDAGKSLKHADAVRDAFKGGDISMDQAAEIVRAEQARPGSSADLLEMASKDSFQVLREQARKVVLEAEQHRGLADRQHEARSARSHTDALGMININLRLEPHVGTPIVNRAEVEAGRLYRKAQKEGRFEPFERLLADAYSSMLSGGGSTKPSKRPEVVVLVSHEVTQRGWTDVREGEICKIPGVGPISPGAAKEIAQDAFVTGVFFDGKDLRHFRRWTRNIPVEVAIALQLGDPPQFDGVKCVDCGRRFRTEDDHVEPWVAGGTTSTDNLKPRCYSCHQRKTERDRNAGRLRPPSRRGDRGPP